MGKSIKLEGWEAMDRYWPGYRNGHLPVWFTKAVRRVMREDLGVSYTPRLHNPHDRVARSALFDHYGSIPSPARDANRWVYTMPYGSYMEEEAKAFAELYGFQMIATAPGIWQPNTTCFLFAPPLSET